jgi:hypothetical protein
MYMEECLARARHQELLSKAEEQRSAQRAAEFRRLRKRQERAERELLRAWQRVEQLHSALYAG